MLIARRGQGITAAFSSALFLGAVPIFGKIAIVSGFSPFALIALRTGIAALLIIAVMAIWNRQYFYMYPVGLVGCLVAGFVNGLGSILYYNALSRLDAGVGHLLYSLYPLIVALYLLIDRQTITRITLVRVILAIPALVLLVQAKSGTIDIPGALMMLAASALYASHLLINQRILFEAPAQSVTLYTLLGMAATVSVGYVLLDRSLPPANAAWWAVGSMALITFFSRLTLFLGVKHLGGLQTALIGLSEIMVTLIFATLLLNERLSTAQWIGAVLLLASLFLVGYDKIPSQKRQATGWLSWLNPPQMPATDINWPKI